MSLFQCQRCGCCENTALASQGFDGYAAAFFDWTGIEDRKGKKLCSACGPTKYSEGSPTEYGQWHGRFPRRFLPLAMFRTAKNGNLEHVETGEQDYRKYEIAPGVAACGVAERVMSDIEAGRSAFRQGKPREGMLNESARIGWDEAAHDSGARACPWQSGQCPVPSNCNSAGRCLNVPRPAGGDAK